MGKKNGVPNGWLDYCSIGKKVEGTRFIPFKVPLKSAICNTRLKPEEWFTPDDALEKIPGLKLIVNLTNTGDGRYYYGSDFESKGVEILRLKCEGRGTLPPQKVMTRFFNAVDAFMSAATTTTTTTTTDNDSLIGVHCTHGLNRTGYFICKYMVDRMDMSANKAIEYRRIKKSRPSTVYEKETSHDGCQANIKEWTADRCGALVPSKRHSASTPQKVFEEARGHKIERQQYLDDLTNKPPEELSWRKRDNHTAGYNNANSSRPLKRKKDISPPDKFMNMNMKSPTTRQEVEGGPHVDFFPNFGAHSRNTVVQNVENANDNNRNYSEQSRNRGNTSVNGLEAGSSSYTSYSNNRNYSQQPYNRTHYIAPKHHSTSQYDQHPPQNYSSKYSYSSPLNDAYEDYSTNYGRTKTKPNDRERYNNGYNNRNHKGRDNNERH